MKLPKFIETIKRVDPFLWYWALPIYLLMFILMILAVIFS